MSPKYMYDKWELDERSLSSNLMREICVKSAFSLAIFIAMAVPALASEVAITSPTIPGPTPTAK